MAKDFRNDASMVGFIGNRTLEDVISCDSAELAAVGGSFEAIGKRMRYFIDGINVEVDSWKRYRYNQLVQEEVDAFDIFAYPLSGSYYFGEKGKEIWRTPRLIPGEQDIECVEHMSMNGLQRCPFTDCSEGGYGSSGSGVDSDLYIIRNRKTNMSLSINNVTAHLAFAHQVLEKDNEYGISAGEFYTHFMPQGNVDLLRRFKRVEGSIEDVAGRMEFLYKRVHDVLFLMYNKGFDPIRKNMNEERDIPSREEWKSLSSQIGTSYTSPMAIPGVEDVELLYNFEGQRYDCTCPVNEHCLVDVKGNNEQYVLRNTISGKELWLNSMVIHLAREHGLLYGDGSQYDICVEDFYESFMK